MNGSRVLRRRIDTISSVIVESAVLLELRLALIVNELRLNLKHMFVAARTWKVLLAGSFQMVSNNLQHLLRRHPPSSRAL
jgi:hypothetical protein